ncbi:MAG: DMT family transporter [Verrucomicrobia bacterium]|nr:DMT family transporter [Verrucomicrobiota bacterium]
MSPWLLWTFAALLSWGVWAILSKLLGDALSPELSQAVSTLGLLPILVPLALSKEAPFRQAPRTGMLWAFLGGIVSSLGNIAYYAALSRGAKAAAVVPLTALYPVVTIITAALLLRERLNRVQQIGLALSFAAIWLFNIQSEDGLVSPAILLALPPIVLWGVSGFLQKLATNHLPARTAALVYLSAFLPVAVFLAVRETWPVSISTRTWTLALALGFFLGFGNLAVLTAFARGGKASVIAPLGSLYPIVSVPIAVLALGETVGRREVFGILFALASVVALAMETPATAAASSPLNPK